MYHLSRSLWPLARLTARRGYFAPRDWATIPARRVALVACHWIGDTFWAAQVVPVLEKRFPEAELFAICKPTAEDLWHGLLEPHRVLLAPQVVSDRLRERPVPLVARSRARQLRKIGFDLAIDLTGNRYSARLTWWLRPAASLGFDGGEFGWLYSHRVPDAERPGRHLSERPFRVIEPLLAARGDSFAYRLPLRPPTPTCPPSDLKGRLGILGRTYFVLAPGAGWPAKERPAERFIEVGAALQCENPGRPGQPIGRVVALLADAHGVLANDSGIAHLAAALGRPTAAVFTGATDPALCRPLGPGDCAKVFQGTDPAEGILRHLTCPRQA